MALAAALTLLASLGLADETRDRVKAGLEALVHDNPAVAELSFRQAVDRSPESADAHALLALSLIEGHHRPEALAEYKRALRLDRRFIDGTRKMSQIVQDFKFREDIPQSWDMEQQDLTLEIFNEPKAHQKESFTPNIKFPEGWLLDGPSARPDIVESRASLSTSGGPDVYNAQDPFDWFVHARKASPDRYRGFKLLQRHEFERAGASGVLLEYHRSLPGYRERFHAYDMILLKEGQYRRAVYQAPESEFDLHREVVSVALESMGF